jgi:hypothetical protein
MFCCKELQQQQQQQKGNALLFFWKSIRFGTTMPMQRIMSERNGSVQTFNVSCPGSIYTGLEQNNNRKQQKKK